MLRVFFSLGFLQVIGILVTTLRSKVLAVLLGPAGFGVVATIDQLVTSTSQFANLSLPFTALKFLSRGHSLGEEQFRQTYAVFLRIIATVALLATLGAVLLVPPLLVRLDPQLVGYRRPVTIALLGVPATILLLFFVNVLAARRRAAGSILLTTLSSVLLLVGGVIGCRLGGIAGVYYATVPAAAALVVGMVIYARAKMGLPPSVPGAGLSPVPAGNTSIFATAAFTYIAINCYSVQLMVARYVSITRLGEEAAGLLQAGLAVSLSVGAVLGPANSAHLTPYLNRDLPVERKVEAAEAFLPRLVLLYCLGALPVVLFPNLVMRLLFSAGFSGAVAILPWFIAWQCLAQVASVYQQLLIGLDDVKIGCVIVSSGHLLAAALCLALIGPLGMVGLAIAFISSVLFIGCAATVRLRAKFRLKVSGSIPVLVAVATLGLLGAARLALLAPELTLSGLGLRLLVALALLGGLWLAMPAQLRSGLSRGFAAKLGPRLRRSE